MNDLEACQRMDRDDPLRHLRERYHVPQGTIYLDGNSLGPMPHAARDRVTRVVEQEWADDLITSWNRHGWFDLPQKVGNKIARLIGGGDGNVIVADTISINQFKALTAALALRRGRNVILSDTGNFPSDLYVAQGLGTFLQGAVSLRTVEPECVLDAITTEVAVVMLTDVDYRTGRRHAMAEITRRAHEKGALVVWDLAHSAGALPVDLLGIGADFAVGCTYKYLNGGPGSPAFIFVHPKWQDDAVPALVGWWGQANPFAFDTQFTPSKGIARMQCGTQAIVSMQVLDAAMDQWADVDMMAVQFKSRSLCRLFIELVEAQCSEFGLKLAGPRDFEQRGSHVSFHCDNGYAVMQAMIARKVIGDFRNPDMIRFGFAPCYNSHVEVFHAAAVLADVLHSQSWNNPVFLGMKSVT